MRERFACFLCDACTSRAVRRRRRTGVYFFVLLDSPYADDPLRRFRRRFAREPDETALVAAAAAAAALSFTTGPWFLRCDAAMRCSFALVTAARRVISGTTCASHSASNTATVTSTDTATARSLESPRLRRRRIHHLAGGPFLVLLPYFLSRPTSLVRCSLFVVVVVVVVVVVALRRSFTCSRLNAQRLCVRVRVRMRACR